MDDILRAIEKEQLQERDEFHSGDIVRVHERIKEGTKERVQVFEGIVLKRAGGGRIAAHEIMLGTPAIRNLIRENKVAQMYSTIQTSAGLGMQTLDQCLRDMVAQGTITREDARRRAVSPDTI